MNFYTSIADFYDYIFQVKPTQISFVKTELEESLNNKAVLEVGCGTGNLSMELAKLANKVEAIDLDEEMLRKAEIKLENNNISVNYKCLNMLELSKHYEEATFDAVVCLGNTLVHLQNNKEILEFFKQARDILKPEGKLLLQIINYDRIIDNNIHELPTIENEFVKFKRNYNYKKDENKLEFETILNVKKEDKVISNKIQLYPIRKNSLQKLLEQSGFKNIKFYGSFNKKEINGKNIPYVISCNI